MRNPDILGKPLGCRCVSRSDKQSKKQQQSNQDATKEARKPRGHKKFKQRKILN